VKNRYRPDRHFLQIALAGLLLVAALSAAPRSMASRALFQTIPTPTPRYTLPPAPTNTPRPPSDTPNPPGDTPSPPGDTPGPPGPTSTPSGDASATPTQAAIPGTPGATPPLLPTSGPTAQIVPSCWAEVSREDVLPGEQIQYSIQVTADVPLTSVVVQDELNPGLELLRVSATQGSVDVRGQTVTLSLGILEPGLTAMAVLDVRVSASAVAGQVFVQQAVLFFDGGQVRCNAVAVGSPPDHLPATGADGRQP
jgi:uncharacterized repeat protein (TIGR01451 family)